MEIYDSRYFVYNKRFQMMMSIWPYQSTAIKSIIRVFLILLMITMSTPQIIRLHRYLGNDLNKSIENLYMLFYICGIYLKFFTNVFAQDKLKVLYERTARNFAIYTAEEEKKILKEYSESGRIITLSFIGFMISAVMAFVTLPLYPIIMDNIHPLDQPRFRMFLLNGDYLIDDNDNYVYIYLFESVASILTVLIMCSTDPMYATIVEHCLGLFIICKFRLRNFNKSRGRKVIDVTQSRNNTIGDKDQAYDALIKAIQLHKDIIEYGYTKIIQQSYSIYFLMEIGICVGAITTVSIIIVMRMNQPLDSARYVFLFMGLLMHAFYLAWPGQKLIDFSSDTLKDTYDNDWYDSSIRCKKLLKFMSLKCLKHSKLTRGGLVTLNLVNFALVVRSSASYIIVLSSL